MTSLSADRAKDTFRFLKQELPSCEDMLQYLDRDDESIPDGLYGDNEI